MGNVGRGNSDASTRRSRTRRGERQGVNVRATTFVHVTRVVNGKGNGRRDRDNASAYNYRLGSRDRDRLFAFGPFRSGLESDSANSLCTSAGSDMSWDHRGSLDLRARGRDSLEGDDESDVVF